MLNQRLAPQTFKAIIADDKVTSGYSSFGTQPIYMPVKAPIPTPMATNPGPEPSQAKRATQVNILPSRKYMLSQATDR